METVAFYSYKGGVGRSLLLAHAARFLATLGVDQDLDSPNFLGGAVPYLMATAEGAASPPQLLPQMINVNPLPNERGWIWLMPAGPAPHRSYWEALKKLGDQVRLDDSSGQGLMSLLDLRARFADEVRPDYLLIPARTGVTDLGGLATTILADTVLCMFVPKSYSKGSFSQLLPPPSPLPEKIFRTFRPSPAL